jgi:hypothetical protein
VKPLRGPNGRSSCALRAQAETNSRMRFVPRGSVFRKARPSCGALSQEKCTSLRSSSRSAGLARSIFSSRAHQRNFRGAFGEATLRAVPCARARLNVRTNRGTESGGETVRCSRVCDCPSPEERLLYFTKRSMMPIVRRLHRLVPISLGGHR